MTKGLKEKFLANYSGCFLSGAFIASLIGLLIPQVSAQSLEETINATLKTNPDIIASRYGVDAAKQLHRQARGGYLPTVDLILATGRESSNNTTTRALNVDELYLTREDRSLKLTQLLYDGFATKSLVRQQSALADAAMARLSNVEEAISLRAIQVYLEVLRRDLVVGLAVKNLNQHDATLSKIRERFESGVGTKVDVVQTEGRRAQSKGNVLLSQRDARNGIAEFFRVVGENPNNLTEPGSVAGLPSTLAEAIQIGLQNNPGLQAAEAELEAARAGYKQARAAYHPRFDLELGATRNDDGDGTVGANDDETAVIRMTYNLYRGGADKARINEAQATEFVSRQNLASINRAVEEDITLVWNELDDILMRLEYLKAHVKSTREVLDVYNEQLSLGKRTLLDLLDIQNELLRAEVALITGEYTAMFASYRVLTSTGRLLPTLQLGGAQ
ncbi:MAG: TolC family outer membrane protein [Pseudomonadales bacterium]|nr:TolC family outer membrane protein [Pseudomonadales bacterium]